MYGKVEAHLFDNLQRMQVKEFVKTIREAAEGKRRPVDLRERQD